jgi:membrane protein implicated in regulation of membrane protease activity
LLAGLCGRGLRFGLEAILIGVYGNAAIESLNWFLENEIILAIMMILSAVLIYYGWKWWNNIELETSSMEHEMSE